MAVALLAICVPTAKAQTAADVYGTLDTLFGSHVPLQNFLEALKKAVAADDRPTVAGMIDYPFRTRINGKALTIGDAAHFVASYDRIITDPVKQAVARQSYSTAGGASKVKITAINH
jgi:hypothetical protein